MIENKKNKNYQLPTYIITYRFFLSISDTIY